MKNRKLTVAVLAAFAIIVCAFTVTGCANNKVYYTIDELPAHVENVSAASDAGYESDGKGTYFNKGTAINITVNLEIGYRIGTLKVFANDEELELVPDNVSASNTLYSTKEKYTVEDAFTVRFSGTPEVITSSVRVTYNDARTENAAYEDDIFLKFSGSDTEYTLKQFKGRNNTVSVKGNEKFGLFVYTKGYDKVGLTSNSTLTDAAENPEVYPLSEFIIKDGKYGIYYNAQVFSDKVFTLDLSLVDGVQIELSKTDTNDRIRLDNDFFAIKVNGSEKPFHSDFGKAYVDFEDYDANGEVKVEIEFAAAVQAKFGDITDGLYFKSNCEGLAVSFRKIAPSKIELTLKRAYAYSERQNGDKTEMDTQYAYRYYFETNLYDKMAAAGFIIPEV